MNDNSKILVDIGAYYQNSHRITKDERLIMIINIWKIEFKILENSEWLPIQQMIDIFQIDIVEYCII